MRATLATPYDDSNHYSCYRDEVEELEAYSIEELYQRMAQVVVAHMLRGEDAEKCTWDRQKKENFTVEFSNIYVEIAPYSVEKMKASKAFQEIGVAREKKWAEEAKIKKENEARAVLARAKAQEERDRQEFLRLSKKFGK